MGNPEAPSDPCGGIRVSIMGAELGMLGDCGGRSMSGRAKETRRYAPGELASPCGVLCTFYIPRMTNDKSLARARIRIRILISFPRHLGI